jgi:hypothetical protein
MPPADLPPPFSRGNISFIFYENKNPEKETD